MYNYKNDYDDLSGEEQDIQNALSSLIINSWEDDIDLKKINDFITKDFTAEELSELRDYADYYGEVVCWTVNMWCDCWCWWDYYSNNYDEIIKGKKHIDKLVKNYRLYQILNNTEKASNYKIVNTKDDPYDDNYENHCDDYEDDYSYFTQKSWFSDFIKKIESKEFLDSIKK